MRSATATGCGSAVVLRLRFCHCASAAVMQKLQLRPYDSTAGGPAETAIASAETAIASAATAPLRHCDCGPVTAACDDALLRLRFDDCASATALLRLRVCGCAAPPRLRGATTTNALLWLLRHYRRRLCGCASEAALLRLRFCDCTFALLHIGRCYRFCWLPPSRTSAVADCDSGTWGVIGR